MPNLTVLYVYKRPQSMMRVAADYLRITLTTSSYRRSQVGGGWDPMTPSQRTEFPSREHKNTSSVFADGSLSQSHN